MNMKLKKILDDIQKTEDKIAELQEHLKRQNTLKQQMEDMEIIKSFRSMKLDSRELLVLLDGIQNIPCYCLCKCKSTGRRDNDSGGGRDNNRKE